MEYFISKVPKGFINLCYLLCMALLLLFTFKPTEAIIGVSYGALGNNLPSPQQVVNLYNAHGIKYMRIYWPDRPTLEALQGSGIRLVVDVPNENIKGLAQNPSQANDWIQQNILPYASFIRYIVVGNEVEQWIRQYVGPALWNIQNALNSHRHCRCIKVSTAIGMSLIKNSYPPSAGEFNDLLFMDPIIYFLEYNGSPLLVNIYPYFAYIANKQYISLDYALFTSPGTVVTDSNNGLQYQNLFDAMVDSVYAALSKRGASNSGTWVIGGETGHPSTGGDSATWQHSSTYHHGVIKHSKVGTPLRPGEMEIYLFSMFDENNKGGAETEKHFGLFYPNGQPKYDLSFTP